MTSQFPTQNKNKILNNKFELNTVNEYFPKNRIENLNYYQNFNNFREGNKSSGINYNKGYISPTSSEEYQGISYLKTGASLMTSQDSINNFSEEKGEINSTSQLGNNIQNKKSVDADFRMKYKTEICKFWALNKECRYGNNCAFAHGNVDIRSKNFTASNYKTKKCKQFYDMGYCPYGSRCQFRHNEDILNLHKKSSSTIIVDSSNFSYKKVIQKLLDTNNLEENVKCNRPRLRAFTSITNESSLIENNLERTFYNEISGLKKGPACIESFYSNSSSDDSEDYEKSLMFMTA